MTLNEFHQLVARHDLTHMYSDDASVYRRGSAELSKIMEAAKQFSREDVVRVWNSEVERKLADGYREGFYWEV